MSTSPAAGLARLRVLFPVWHFSRVEMASWSGYIARRSPRHGDGLGHRREEPWPRSSWSCARKEVA